VDTGTAYRRGVVVVHILVGIDHIVEVLVVVVDDDVHQDLVVDIVPVTDNVEDIVDSLMIDLDSYLELVVHYHICPIMSIRMLDPIQKQTLKHFLLVPTNLTMCKIWSCFKQENYVLDTIIERNDTFLDICASV
jgi:hypothetical protein